MAQRKQKDVSVWNSLLYMNSYTEQYVWCINGKHNIYVHTDYDILYIGIFSVHLIVE